MTFSLEDVLILGANEHWQFGVGRQGERWIGFAFGRLEDGHGYLHVLTEVCDEPWLVDVTDRDRVIRMTGAVACDPEASWGGVAEWYVDEELRGDPEEFRCDVCGQVGCRGGCREDDGFDFDDGA